MFTDLYHRNSIVTCNHETRHKRNNLYCFHCWKQLWRKNSW